MSCYDEVSATGLRRWKHLFLCASCEQLASKAAAEIDQNFSRARAHAEVWLEQHVMRGGLLSGRAGCEHGTGPRPPRVPEASS